MISIAAAEVARSKATVSSNSVVKMARATPLEKADNVAILYCSGSEGPGPVLPTDIPEDREPRRDGGAGEEVPGTGVFSGMTRSPPGCTSPATSR